MTARFTECFADLQDPRVERNRLYPLMEILLRVICAMLSGAEGWEAMEDFGEAKLDGLRKFASITLSTPSMPIPVPSRIDSGPKPRSIRRRKNYASRLRRGLSHGPSCRYGFSQSLSLSPVPACWAFHPLITRYCRAYYLYLFPDSQAACQTAKAQRQNGALLPPARGKDSGLTPFIGAKILFCLKLCKKARSLLMQRHLPYFFEGCPNVHLH